ncbi:MAG: hypothetical protein LIO87_01305 [Eubacterium sp.]|nr:hypothetical protein [Eubacterium sp.]
MTNTFSKFETGNIYNYGWRAIEIIKKTPKTITYSVIDHYGNFNERRTEPKRAKLLSHTYTERFMADGYEAAAAEAV